MPNPSSHFEYRFGWRWLLPLEPGQNIALIGFEQQERAWWRAVLKPATVVHAAGLPQGLIIDAQRASVQPPSMRLMIGAAQWVAVAGPQALVRQWRRFFDDSFLPIREYGLLPAENPRVVIPLGSPRHTREALHLLRPVSTSGRLSVALARALTCAGSSGLLRRRVMLIAERPGCAAPMSAVTAKMPAAGNTGYADFALDLGSPGGQGITAALPMNGARPDCLLKHATAPEAKQRLLQEAQALQELSRTPCAGHIPRFGGLIEHAPSLTLCQEYRRPRRAGRQRLNRAIIAFLGRLAAIDCTTKHAGALLEGLVPPVTAPLPPHYPVSLRATAQRLREHADRSSLLFLHRTHGDFTRWNCSWTRHGLFVCGWGQSRQQGLALGDAFSYVTAPALLQPEPDPDAIVAAALSFGSRVAAAAGFLGITVQIYLALWLLQRADKEFLYQVMLQSLEEIWQ